MRYFKYIFVGVFFITNSTFGYTVVDSYPEANKNTNSGLYGSQSEMCQSFTGDGQILKESQFQLAKYNSPTGNITSKLYAHTGTYGTSSVPTGSALDTSNSVDSTTLTSTPTYALVSFTFSGNYTLASDSYYVICFVFSGGDVNNQVANGLDDSSPTHDGNLSIYTGSFTGYSGLDLIFYVNGDPVGTPTPNPANYASGSYYDLDITQNTFYHAITIMFFSFLFPVWYFNKKRNDSLIQLKKK